ncbi:MAG: hypothetical protein B6241_05900 [Spirochaetaceae bacterium 4572_59]|nr:MAG: hypothetical protein B6241_05900 [Spirochaetaceae bacterium 4572_59]
MVLYNPDAIISFSRYGIAIPSLDSRKSNTIKALLDTPRLGEISDQWYIKDIAQCINREDLERSHTKEYVDSLFTSEEGLKKALLQAYELLDEDGHYKRYSPETAEADLPEILNDVMRIISGSYLNIKQALDQGFSYYLGGGMHHAHPDFGHGFCLLNDVCISLLKAQSEGLFQRAWVLDVDAHRGDGTAEILSANDSIKSLSIHMAEGWPLDSPEILPDGRKNPSWFPGDVDIPIKSGEEKQYIPRLMAAMEELEKDGKPDLVFVVGGVDPYERDELASTSTLSLTKEQMLERDQSLYRFLDSRSISQAWVAAGGYGSSSWEIHTAFLNWALFERFKP